MIIDYTRYYGGLRDQLAAIADDYQRGLTFKQLSDKYRRYRHGPYSHYPTAQNVKYALERIGVVKIARRPLLSLEGSRIFAARDKEMLELARGGAKLKDIAKKFGISRARAGSIIQREKRRALTRQILDLQYESRWKHYKRRFQNLGRPIDMGGPRDVWIDE